MLACAGPSTVDISTPGNDEPYTVTAQDTFGRTSTATVLYSVYDLAPSLTISGPSVVSTPTATFTFAVSDPDDPVSSDTVHCTVDGSSPAASCSLNGATISNLAPGQTHTLSVTITDPWGASVTRSTSVAVDYATTTTAQKVVPNVPNVSATVTYSFNGSNLGPVVNEPQDGSGGIVTFYAGQNGTSGSKLCTAVPDPNTGTASCGGLSGTAVAVAAGGVTAVFSGDPARFYLGSSGSAGVLQ